MKKNIFFIINKFKTLSLISTISLIMLFAIEYSFRLLKYTRNSISRNNFERKNSEDLEKAYDNIFSIEEILDMQELYSARTLQYRPWVQIGNSDHKHKYSIVKDGKRKTYSIQENCRNPIEVWFFGGSTMFGTGSSWVTSIPSEFVKFAEINNQCINALNFGVPYHYSLQEVIYFSTELAKNNFKKPNYAVFLDGLNDFGQPGSSLRKEPFFTPVISSVFKPTNDLNKIDLKLVTFNFESVRFLQRIISSRLIRNPNLGYTNRTLPIGYDAEKSAIEISQNILSSSTYLNKICKINKIKCFHYLQPVAAIKYKPNGEKLTSWIEDENVKNRYSIGYKETSNLLKKIDGANNYKFVNLSDLFLNFQGIPYVDSGHYSPRANSLIAEEIYKSIFF